MSLFTPKITVRPGTVLVEYVRGCFTRVLEPGEHNQPRRSAYVAVPVRDQVSTLAQQEVPTADGLALRVTAAVRWSVTDARRYVEVAEKPFDLVYLAIQVALREIVVDVEAVEAAAHVRRGAAAAMLAAARSAGAQVGIEVSDVLVKDIVVPFEIRSAQAELATARARGQAQLEKARADVAVLRSMANAARMLDEHPALARMRLVESLPHGAKVELSVGDRD